MSDNTFRAIGATTFLSPLPAVLVSCKGTQPGFDRENMITIGWAGVINSDPPMVSISIRKERHSHAQISQSGVFCVNLTTQDLCRATDYCGVKSGRDVDKFADLGLHAFYPEGFDAPALAEAPLLRSKTWPSFPVPSIWTSVSPASAVFWAATEAPAV